MSGLGVCILRMHDFQGSSWVDIHMCRDLHLLNTQQMGASTTLCLS